MSEAKKRIEQLIDHLEKDIKLSEVMLGLIRKQRSKIGLVDSEGLDSVNAEIEKIAEVIREHASVRSENLRFLGFEPDEKGLEKLANKLPAKIKGKIIELKNHLESNIESCKTANEQSANQLILSKEMLSKITGETQNGYLE